MKIFKCIFMILVLSMITTMSYAGVVVKIVGVNPSKTQSKKAILKSYMPEEILPEHVESLGELQLLYDDQKKLYYVYGEVELKPGETVEKEIELMDIWHIKEEELARKYADMQKIMSVLQRSEFGDKVAYLQGSIESKLKVIEDNQKTQAENPQKHIFTYRMNLELMTQVDQELDVARNLMLSVKRIPTVKIWKLIILVIVLLGVFAAGLYFVWFKKIELSDIYSSSSESGQNDFVSKK